MKSKIIVIFVLFSIGLVTAQTNRLCYSCSGQGCLDSLGTELDCGGASDSCYTIYTKFLPTKRGCVSQLTETAEKLACETATDKSCSVCAENKCNILAHEDHTCLYCTSLQDPKCLTLPEEVEKKRCAAPDFEEPACFVKVQGSVTERGCLSSMENFEECEADPLCKSCSIASEKSGCNSYDYPDYRQKCFITQDGETETLEYCNKWDDQCVTINAKGYFRKYCESDLPDDDVQFCAESPNRCHKCGERECNSGSFAMEQTQCRSCSSATDANCIDNPQAVPVVACKHGCATVVEPNADGKLVTKRLCVEELTAENKVRCAAGASEADNYYCQSCGTQNCNSAVYPKGRLSCFHCNQAPCNTQTSVKSATCPYYLDEDQCVAIRTGTTVESLSCKSSLSEADATFCEQGTVVEGRQCTHCAGSNCNDPATLFKSPSCVQCSSSENKLCASHPAALLATPCKNTAESSCYTQNVGDTTKRGCLSDLSATEQVVCIDGKTTCLACVDTAGCNKKVFPVDRLMCHQCDSTTNPACHLAEAIEPEICDTIDQNIKCFTLVDETGAVTRKCSKLDLATECGSSLYCRACTSTGCNDESPAFSTPTEPDIVRPTLAPDVTTTTSRTTTTATPLTTTTPSSAHHPFASVLLLTVLLAACV